MFYNFKNIIAIKVTENYKWKDGLFLEQVAIKIDEDEYINFKDRIEIVYSQKLDYTGMRKVEENNYIGKNKYINSKFGVHISRNLDNDIVLTTVHECNEWLIILLQLRLIELGFTLVHGAALERDGRAILFPSWGGVGKTATVVKMINKDNWKLLGDDLFIVGNGKVYSFLKDFVIYHYHKSLFPRQFKNKRNVIVGGKLFSKFYSKIIPVIKNILRKTPKLLTFARKHNPQSFKVSPRKIFDISQMSDEAMVKQIVWLERVKANDTLYDVIDYNFLISKIISVTNLEVFGENLSSVLVLSATNVIDSKNVFYDMYDILNEQFKTKDYYNFDIAESVNINEVGDKVIQMINETWRN